VRMLDFASSVSSFFLEIFFDFCGSTAEVIFDAIAESTPNRKCDILEVLAMEKSVFVVSHCLMFEPSPMLAAWLSYPARLVREIARL